MFFQWKGPPFNIFVGVTFMKPYLCKVCANFHVCHQVVQKPPPFQQGIFVLLLNIYKFELLEAKTYYAGQR